MYCRNVYENGDIFIILRRSNVCVTPYMGVVNYDFWASAIAVVHLFRMSMLYNCCYTTFVRDVLK